MIHLVYSQNGLKKLEQVRLTGSIVDMCNISLQDDFKQPILNGEDRLFVLAQNLSYEQLLEMLVTENSMSWY